MRKITLEDRPDFKLSAVDNGDNSYTIYYNEVGKKKSSVKLYKKEIKELVKWIIND